MSVPKFLTVDLTPSLSYSFLRGWYLAPFIDKDRITKQTTTTGASDSAYTSVYFNAAGAVDYTCNRVFVFNHNLKFGNGIGIYLNTSGPTLQNLIRTDITNSNGTRVSIFTFDDTTLNSVEVVFLETEPANQQKSVAEVIVTGDQISISREMTNYEYRFREKSRDMNLGSGKYHRIIRAQTNGKTDRYEANCQFRYINQTDLESLRTLYKTHATFYFQPEPDTRPQDIFLCYMTNPWNVSYSSKDKNAGYTVNIQVKEV